jgi:DNA-binding MarR family transcriptional regulator
VARFEILREVTRLYLRQQRDAVACCDGTSVTQCWIVTELGRSGAMTLGDLATAVGFDKSWTSRTVDSLVATGVVAKNTDADDARRIRITLTRKGERRYEALSDSLNAHARGVLARIRRKQRRRVEEALAALHEALQENQ